MVWSADLLGENHLGDHGVVAASWAPTISRHTAIRDTEGGPRRTCYWDRSTPASSRPGYQTRRSRSGGPSRAPREELRATAALAREWVANQELVKEEPVSTVEAQCRQDVHASGAGYTRSVVQGEKGIEYIRYRQSGDIRSDMRISRGNGSLKLRPGVPEVSGKFRLDLIRADEPSKEHRRLLDQPLEGAIIE